MTNDNTRTWLLIALGFIIFWVLYLAILAPRRPAPLQDLGTGQPASYNWSLVDLKGDVVPFSRFKGKPVFLNVWATWCGPCVQEMPSIARLARDPRLQGKGIEFVCVSIDGSTADVRRFLEGRSWSMTFLRAERLPGVFSTDGIPATFIIGPDGWVAAAEVGSAQWDTPEIVGLLEKLAAMPPRPL